MVIVTAVNKNMFPQNYTHLVRQLKNLFGSISSLIILVNVFLAAKIVVSWIREYGRSE